jgi:hypothetical protein
VSSDPGKLCLTLCAACADHRGGREAWRDRHAGAAAGCPQHTAARYHVCQLTVSVSAKSVSETSAAGTGSLKRGAVSPRARLLRLQNCQSGSAYCTSAASPALWPTAAVPTWMRSERESACRVQLPSSTQSRLVTSCCAPSWHRAFALLHAPTGDFQGNLAFKLPHSICPSC